MWPLFGPGKLDCGGVFHIYCKSPLRVVTLRRSGPRLPVISGATILDLMNEVTRILNAMDEGDPHAAAELLPLVYDELRKLAAGHMANESAGHTLDATALVHEAYLRLVGSP